LEKTAKPNWTGEGRGIIEVYLGNIGKARGAKNPVGSARKLEVGFHKMKRKKENPKKKA